MVLQQIIMRIENLCSRIGFYTTIVAISLYIDCRVVVCQALPEWDYNVKLKAFYYNSILMYKWQTKL